MGQGMDFKIKCILTPEHVYIRPNNARDKENLRNFVFTQATSYSIVKKPGMVKAKYVPDKHFVFYLSHLKMYGMLRTDFDAFYDWCLNGGYTSAMFDIEEHIPYAGDDIHDELSYNKGIKPRYYQEDIIKWVTETNELIRIIPIQMGMGKTFITLYSLGKIRKRSMIVLKSRDVPTWIKEIKNIYKDGDKKFLLIRGNKELIKLMHMDKDELPPLILVTINTMRAYIDQFLGKYKPKKEREYIYTPDQLLENLGVGVVVNDESHENIHYIHKQLIALDIYKRISLSATLESLEKTMKMRLVRLYPYHLRYNELQWFKFLYIYPVRYYLYNPRYQVYKAYGRGQVYDHKVYEKWLLSNDYRRKNFLKMILYLIKNYYSKKEGHRCLILASLVSTTEWLAEEIQKAYPDLNVISYTAKVDKQELYKNDIVISTPGSAGTGVDINQLQLIINTVMYKSIQANLQIAGRIRRGQIGDTQPIYIYTYCADNEKHMEYNNLLSTLLKIRIAKKYEQVGKEFTI